MFPQILHLHLPFELPIIGHQLILHSYGLMMVAAFLATQWLSTRLAARKQINPEIFVNVTLIALVSGVIGSRISHVLENLHDYTIPELGFRGNFLNMINLTAGGLTFYGGFIFASPCVLVYLIYKKVPVKVAMDIVAPCLMVGLGIGRIGCFLNGCCYGADTTLPWGLSFPYYSNAYIDQFYGTSGSTLNHRVPKALLVTTQDDRYRLRDPAEFANDAKVQAIAAKERSNPVHPTQLYSTFNSLLIAALLLAYFTIPHAPGRVFAWMLLLEGPSRFLLELLRVEPPVYPAWFGPMSLSMVIGIGLFIIGIVLWTAFRSRKLAEG